MKIILIKTTLLLLISNFTFGQQSSETKKVMDGFPASRESQVSFQNHRDYPFNKWSFRNMGAPLPVLMVPRGGVVHIFKEANKNNVGNTPITVQSGNTKSFEAIFKDNDADGIIVVKDNKIYYENYWNGLTKDYQHIWYSITKSLASTGLGILVSEKKIDLSASPVRYVPELKGTPWERTTIQDVLNMSTALGYQESYTDTSSFIYKNYWSVNNFFYVPNTDKDPKTALVLGSYDFLTKKATQSDSLKPAYKTEYNSSNADVISWIISKVTGKTFNEFIHEKIWAKIGAEHDAYMTADNSYTAEATGGMNSTLRDIALFGTLVLNRGQMDNRQIVPAEWIDETLKLTTADKERYARNDRYVKAFPFIAYKNFWWILDETKGEYLGQGIHGQILYINRSAKMVIAFFSSTPNASGIGYTNFADKLTACRELSKNLKE
jgi:CubicO group peptidase (beta-lactamase class C family)